MILLSIAGFTQRNKAEIYAVQLCWNFINSAHSRYSNAKMSPAWLNFGRKYYYRLAFKYPPIRSYMKHGRRLFADTDDWWNPYVPSSLFFPRVFLPQLDIFADCRSAQLPPKHLLWVRFCASLFYITSYHDDVKLPFLVFFLAQHTNTVVDC